MKMAGFGNLCLLTVFAAGVQSLLMRGKEESILNPIALSVGDECDPSSIPVMDNFDMKRFSGAWFELAKSASGYIDVNDGMWKILTTNVSSTFLYSGRDNNGHCIRPIKGKISAEDQPPGTLKLQYMTFSTHVEETIRVLFTDYETIAVIYLCMHHVHREKEVCHAAGIMGAVWTRNPHVEVDVYENAVRYLEMACVHRSVLILRNQVGPCKVDDLGFRIDDDFPAPDFCYQPLDLGYCRGSIQRYYHEPKTRSCQAFSFSGCGGNRNNFMSLPECQDSCLSASVNEPVCTSVAECAIHCSPCCSEDRNGCVECNCEHIIEDHNLSCMKNPAYCQNGCAVQEFSPGCYICNCHDINEPFIDMPACLEVKSTGDCKEEIKRYYYNALHGICEEFIYTGCKENKNNFLTQKECQDKCEDSSLLRSVVNGGELDDDNSATKHSAWTIGLFILVLITLMLYKS